MQANKKIFSPRCRGLEIPINFELFRNGHLVFLTLEDWNFPFFFFFPLSAIGNNGHGWIFLSKIEGEEEAMWGIVRCVSGRNYVLCDREEEEEEGGIKATHPNSNYV